MRRLGSCVTLVSRGTGGGSSPIASWRKRRLCGRPTGGEPGGVVGTRDVRWRIALFSGVSNGLGDLARVRSYAGDLALFLISSTDTGLLIKSASLSSANILSEELCSCCISLRWRAFVRTAFIAEFRLLSSSLSLSPNDNLRRVSSISKGDGLPLIVSSLYRGSIDESE